MGFTIEVPATLANLGSGYDVLGVAVGVHNTFTFEPAGTWSSDEAVGAEHLALVTARRAADRFGGRLEPLHVRQVEAVPRARGMGSSATARVAGLLAWRASTGGAPTVADQLAFLSDEEGHPDNVVPAFLGGFSVVVDGGRIARTLRVQSPPAVALCIPDLEVHTPAARAAIPAKVPHVDAVYSVGRAALLITGLLQGDFEAVCAGVEDRLHQPYRMPLIGPVSASFAAARDRGAAPFVSGSGSTLAAFVPDGTDALAVAEALAGPLRATGLACRTLATAVRTEGAAVR